MTPIEDYEAMLRRAWVQTRLAGDCWAMAVALVGVVGHAAVVLSGAPVYRALSCWAMALCMMTCGVVFVTLGRNATYLTQVLRGQTDGDVVLGVLDAVRTLFLVTAVLVTILMVALPA